MKFYAVIHDYDIRFTNDVRIIVRFGSKAERDEWVEEETPDRNGNYHREAVSRAKAYAMFRKAFHLSYYDESDMTDWMQDGSHEIWYEDIRLERAYRSWAVAC